MIYKFLKIVVGLGIELFYKEIRVNNKKNLKYDGPLIIIANHPNTIMDGWIIGHMCKDPIYYLAKATFFNSPIKMKFLRALGLIPINRATESKTAGVSNIDSFEMCYQTLEEGKTLVVFPEGTSHLERQLRDLKTGTARIALEVLKRSKTKNSIRIVPVGLVYSQAEKFRSSVLVNVGQPINPEPYLNDYTTDSSRTAKQLTHIFEKELNQLLVNSNSFEHEFLVDDIVPILFSQYVRRPEKGVEREAAQLKETNGRINLIREENPERLNEIIELTDKIKREITFLDIKPDFLDRTYRPRMFVRQLLQSILALIVGLPFFIFGAIHNIVQYKVTDFILVKKVKELEYYAPVGVLLGLVLYPLTYWGFVKLIDHFIELSLWMKTMYFVLMPITGILAFHFKKYSGHIIEKLNFIFLMKTQQETINSLKASREKLRTLIFD